MTKDLIKPKNIVAVPFGLAGASVGFGLAGKAFNSQGLTDAGTAASGFISPAINIGVGGSLIKQLKNIRRDKK